MTRQNGVLIIDDDPQVLQALTSALAPAYTVHVASSGEEGLSRYDHVRPTVVLLDVMLPQMSGLAVLRTLKRQRADQAVIMMTAFAEVQTAVQAIKLGAVDYLQKPLDPDVVREEVERVIARDTESAEPVRARVIGESAAMKRAWRLVERFGPTDIPILLQGETGTGKGLIAEAVHLLSKRSAATFVAIDCATIPEELAESELFGYEDGAFTGAGKRKRGRVAFADRGTLFLDEIGTLALGTQAKLLTLIEQQKFLPLGARQLQPMHLDVRFVSATNVPLHRAVEEGTFRSDLFHRLNGVTIELPPLRDREQDVERLARQFVGHFGRQHGRADLDISADAIHAIKQYAWPGNIRELQRVLSAAVILADGTITLDDLPAQVRAACEPSPVARAPQLNPLGTMSTRPEGPIDLREIKEWAGREAQKHIIIELQKRSKISRQELARILGIDPKTLRSRLKEIDMEH